MIVYDVFKHENQEQVYSFSNAFFDTETFTWIRQILHLIIGATNDNNAPQPKPIDGDKLWQTGTYYFGAIYQNTTFDINFYHYLEFQIATMNKI